MSSSQRYAIVGTGGRSFMFGKALLKTYAKTAKLAALCDLNPLRIAAWQAQMGTKLPAYAPADFARMIKRERIDTVIVTTMDRTHHTYICAAMEAGCDVITEKPMTTDAVKCREIMDTQARTGKQVRVTFNYRYAPRNSKVKELLMSGAIGRVHSVHFEWLLDTKHGADYFRRWHRDKANSGGLMVHKATHHFDLVNWWIDSVPQTVMAMGDLAFYGRANAEARGVTEFYARGTDSPLAKQDPFALDLKGDETMRKLYHECEAADGYQRDQSVFSHGISIEDDMGVMVRYRNRAVMTYHLTAYSPWEGYRVAFNGDTGRIEYDVTENPYVSATAGDHNFAKNVKGGAEHVVEEPVQLLLRPHWGPPQKVEIPKTNEGGHGGADGRMLADIFGAKPPVDPLERAAGVEAGAWSIMTGIAANQSMASGLPVDVASLVPGLTR